MSSNMIPLQEEQNASRQPTNDHLPAPVLIYYCSMGQKARKSPSAVPSTDTRTPPPSNTNKLRRTKIRIIMQSRWRGAWKRVAAPAPNCCCAVVKSFVLSFERSFRHSCFCCSRYNLYDSRKRTNSYLYYGIVTLEQYHGGSNAFLSEFEHDTVSQYRTGNIGSKKISRRTRVRILSACAVLTQTYWCTYHSDRYAYRRPLWECNRSEKFET